MRHSLDGAAMRHKAVVRRCLQFVAGPEKTMFFACEEHVNKLGVGTTDGATDVSCFYATVGCPPEPVSPEDDVACWFCREG